MLIDTPSADAWSDADLVAFVRRGVRVAPAMIEQMKSWPGVDVGFLANSVRHGLNDLVARGELGRYTLSGNSYVHYLPEEALDTESLTDRRERIRTHILRKMTPGAWIAGKRLHLEVGAGSKQEVKLAVRSLVDDGSLATSAVGQRADFGQVALCRVVDEPAADPDAMADAPVDLGANAALFDDALRFIAAAGAVRDDALRQRYEDHQIIGADGEVDPFASIVIELSGEGLIDTVPVRGSWPAVRYRLSAQGCAYLAQQPERPETSAKEPGYVVPDLASSTRAKLIHVLDNARRVKSEAKAPVFITLTETGRLKVVVGFGEPAKEPQNLRTVRALRASIALYQSDAEDVLSEIGGPVDAWSERRVALLITDRFMALARWGDWSDRTDFVKRVKFGAVPLFFLTKPDQETLRKRKDAFLRQLS